MGIAGCPGARPIETLPRARGDRLKIYISAINEVHVLAAWRPRAGGTWEEKLVAQLQATRAGRSKPFSTGEVKYII